MYDQTGLPHGIADVIRVAPTTSCSSVMPCWNCVLGRAHNISCSPMVSRHLWMVRTVAPQRRWLRSVVEQRPIWMVRVVEPRRRWMVNVFALRRLWLSCICIMRPECKCTWVYVRTMPQTHDVLEVCSRPRTRTRIVTQWTTAPMGGKCVCTTSAIVGECC